MEYLNDNLFYVLEKHIRLESSTGYNGRDKMLYVKLRSMTVDFTNSIM